MERRPSDNVPRTVLLVEDHPGHAEVALETLKEPEGAWRVEWVTRLRPALERLARSPVDVVMLDLQLPDSEGLETVVQLCAQAPSVAVVVLTADAADAETRAEALRHGAQDYLVKGTVDPALLRRVLDHAIERKRTADALVESQKLESLGVLAGSIAHDFNNLLGAILGQTGLALGKLPPQSPACANLQKAMNAAERAADLARQMLAYAGRGAVRVGPIHLNTVIRDHVRLLQAAIPKHVLLRTDLAEALPPVHADAGQVQQVIVNLILNAVDAIGTRSGTVTLATRRVVLGADELRGWQRPGISRLEPGAYVHLEVRDTGSGIEPAAMPRIFEPFFTTKQLGRGLGLSTVFGIMRGHGGSVRARSEAGRGATFELLFRAAPEVAEAPRPPAPPLAVPFTGHGLVLVMEDEPDLSDATQQMLAAAGFEVLTAADGRAGLEVFDARAADVRLVLLDLSMPVMSGEETFRELRRRRPEVPIILCSGFDHADVKRRFAGERVSAFLQKPWTMAQLLDAVRRSLPPSP